MPDLSCGILLAALFQLGLQEGHLSAAQQVAGNLHARTTHTKGIPAPIRLFKSLMFWPPLGLKLPAKQRTMLALTSAVPHFEGILLLTGCCLPCIARMAPMQPRQPASVSWPDYFWTYGIGLGASAYDHAWRACMQSPLYLANVC